MTAGAIDYGRALRVARAITGTTVNDLARRSCISESVIKRIERGQNPKTEHISGLARAFGRSETWLMSLAHGLLIEEDAEGRILANVKLQ